MYSNTAKKVISLVTLITVSLLLFVTGFYSLAWFADILHSGNLGFGAGTLDDNELKIARVVRQPGVIEVPTESMRSYDLCDDMHIEHDSLPESNGDAYTISMDKMTFGLIDNIALLNPENIVYFRLAVPKRNGNTVKVKFYYDVDADGNFVDLYQNGVDAEGNPVQVAVTDNDMFDADTTVRDAFQNIQKTSTEGDSFLRFSVHVSNVDYDATVLHTLDFYGEDGKVANADSNTYFRFASFDESSDSVTVVNENMDEVEDFYYVYVRVEPDLSVFGQAVEYITSIMPCYSYFKVKACFEVYEGGQG